MIPNHDSCLTIQDERSADGRSDERLPYRRARRTTNESTSEDGHRNVGRPAYARYACCGEGIRRQRGGRRGCGWAVGTYFTARVWRNFDRRKLPMRDGGTVWRFSFWTLESGAADGGARRRYARLLDD